MNLFEMLRRDVSQSVSFVPPVRAEGNHFVRGQSSPRSQGDGSDAQHVEGDLTTNRIGQIVVTELLLEYVDERGANFVDLGERLVRRD